jgi:hypothetical protein
MLVDAATVEKLRSVLLGASGSARAWLAPEGEGAKLRFYLEEILIAGRRGP